MNYNLHYDIALYIFKEIEKKFKYDNKWYFLENDNWILDVKNKRLINEIKTNIANKYIASSLELNNSISYDNEYKSKRLLEVSLKLKSDKYLKIIINELRQFY